MTDRRKAWLLKAMMITASASVLAACQTTSPYVERRAAEMAPPPPPTYDNPPEPLAPTAAPSGTISSEPLPPAPQPYTPPPPPPPAYTPPPPPAPPQYRMVTTGRVVDADGPPQVYTVKSGDNLDAIARDMGLSRNELAGLNDLKSPYLLKPGQKLTGPASKRKAYTVVSGDTLSAIGRRFSVTVQAIADANDIDQSDPIRPNQRLILPEGYKDLGAQRVMVTPPPTPAYTPPAPTPTYTPPAPTPTPAPSASTYPRPSTPPAATPTPPSTPTTTVYNRLGQQPSAPVSAQPVTPAPTPTPTPRPAAPAITATAPADSQIQAIGRGKFIWPVRGRTISAFGARGAMERRDGINISASSGTSVRAAAAGSVIYAGTAPGPLSDYGNLVLVQHADGFISVYAHLSRILVQNQAVLRQNQEIGEVGQTGTVTEPQLYFEMRFAARPTDKPAPFDPILVLPRQ